MNLNDRQLYILLDMVQQVCGMRIEKMLERLNHALDTRLKATRKRSVDKYIELLQNDSGEVANFVNVLTINWTFFFRENQHCEFLLENLESSRYYKIWSAACSTGAEPYSIAIQFLEHGFNFTMLATDISDIALDKARMAVYAYESVSEVPDQILQKYFQKGHGKQKGYVKVKDDVRKYITLKKHNLLSNTQPIGQYDIIFCRNVLMYFDHNDREKVIQTLYRALNHDGYLVTGRAENIFGYNHKFKSIKKRETIYRKLE